MNMPDVLVLNYIRWRLINNDVGRSVLCAITGQGVTLTYLDVEI